MTKESKNSKNSTVIKLKKGEMVDLNIGYYTAPSDGSLIFEGGTWVFETTCGTCDRKCWNEWCISEDE